MNRSFYPRLMLYIGLGFLFLLNSCTSPQVVKEAKPSIFFNKKMELPFSSILLQINIPYDSIWSKIGFVANKKVFEIREGEGADPLEITLKNIPSLKKKGSQLEVTNAILKIKAKPSIAGMNAGWIEGVVRVSMQLVINNLDPNSLSFVETKYQYQWIEKPKVNMLGFGVNVSGLVDKYVGSNEEKIKSVLLSKLNASVQPNQWLPSFKTQLAKAQFGNFKALDPNLDLLVQNVNFKEKGLNLQIQLRGMLGFQFIDNSQVLAYELKGMKENLIYFFADKSSIERMLQSVLAKEIANNSSKNIKIDTISGNGLKVTLTGFLGKRSRANFNVNVGLSDSIAQFKLSNLVTTNMGFGYQLFGGNLERKLNRKINKRPINFQEMLARGLGEMYKDWFKVEEIRGNPNGLVLVVSYVKPNFEINL